MGQQRGFTTQCLCLDTVSDCNRQNDRQTDWQTFRRWLTALCNASCGKNYSPEGLVAMLWSYTMSQRVLIIGLPEQTADYLLPLLSPRREEELYAMALSLCLPMLIMQIRSCGCMSPRRICRAMVRVARMAIVQPWAAAALLGYRPTRIDSGAHYSFRGAIANIGLLSLTLTNPLP